MNKHTHTPNTDEQTGHTHYTQVNKHTHYTTHTHAHALLHTIHKLGSNMTTKLNYYFFFGNVLNKYKYTTHVLHYKNKKNSKLM